VDFSLHDKDGDQEKKQRPVVAVLTYDDGKRIFRGNKENFIALMKTGAELGVHMYVTSTSDFKLADSKITGYMYDSHKRKWIKGPQPVPHVVYNRIPFRKFELLPEVQQTLQMCMKSNQVQLFNPTFFNKWTLHEWLSKSKETRNLVPVTQRMTSSDELEKLLAKHPQLYLKPVRGKAGKGIMKVGRSTSRFRPGGYQLSIQEDTRSQLSRFRTVPQLWSQLRQMTDGKEYIMQQAISLTNYKKRPFDLRALIQKNGSGEWTVAGIGARLAGKSSITTHVPRGGSIDNPKKLLSATFGPDGSKRIISQSKQKAIILAKQIENASGYELGEMSMDLGVDTSGNIWFFEANSKPMKFDEPHIRKRSLRNLVQYCIHLTKQKKKDLTFESIASGKKRTANRIKRKKSG
jgi:hypothetical protein